MKKIYKFLCVLLVALMPVSVRVFALQDDAQAKNITDEVTIRAENFESISRLTDGAENKGAKTDNGKLFIKSNEIIGSIYIVFNSDAVNWDLSCEHGTVTCGEYGFLHEYVEIEKSIGETKELTLHFKNNTDISEIYVFSSGDKPEWVQVWKAPAEHADILLFVAHSDDDQLFFAGLIPYYSAKGYTVQVSYLTYHNDTMRRRHELLNGLWVAGTKYYPFYEKFDDFLIEDLDRTISEYERRGTEYEELEGFVVECIRRSKPQVVVSHDPDGEYGHGMHMLLSKLVQDSVNVCPDENRYPDSASKYGVWCQKKTYLHLYEQNKLTFDIDTPMEELNGKTPFQVSQDAFKMHKSQDFTWFYPWIYGTDTRPITAASQIKKYSPRYYGLYDTRVGYDTGKNDLLENVFSYKMQNEYTTQIYGLEKNIIKIEESINAVDLKLAEYEKMKNMHSELQEGLNTLNVKSMEMKEGISSLRNQLDSFEGPKTSFDAIAVVFLCMFLASFGVITFRVLMVMFFDNTPQKNKIKTGQHSKKDLH